MSLKWRKGNFMHLPRVVVQSDELYSWAFKVIDDYFARGGGSCNIIAELAMRPLDIMYDVECSRRVWAFTLYDGISNVDILGQGGAVNTNRLEQVSTSYDGMGAFPVDVNGRNLGSISRLET
jgi:hypothetical protein